MLGAPVRATTPTARKSRPPSRRWPASRTSKARSSSSATSTAPSRPSTPDPAGATLHPEARRALRHLGRIARGRPERLALAILSGRTALDVAGRVRIGGVTYLGDHGLQGADLPPRVAAERMRVSHAPHHADHAVASRRLGDDVGRLLADAEWLYVEPKGPSVAFHYRTADERGQRPGARILAALGAAQGALPPDLRGAAFTRHETWRIVEVRPEDAGMKGEAVTDLIRRHGASAVAVLGDDRSDAAAFRIVTAARAAGRLAAALDVGVRRAETHPEVVAAADVMLPGPGERRALSCAPWRGVSRRRSAPRREPRTGGSLDRAGRDLYGRAAVSAGAAAPTLSRNGPGKSPSTTVITAVMTNPVRRSQPCATGADSPAGSRMYIVTTTRR